MNLLYDEQLRYYPEVEDIIEMDLILKNQEIFNEDSNLNFVTNIEFDGIDHEDYPDYCDAHICEASFRGRIMLQKELDVLNENTDFVYEQVMSYLY